MHASNADNDMEDGELSDDAMDLPMNGIQHWHQNGFTLSIKKQVVQISTLLMPKLQKRFRQEPSIFKFVIIFQEYSALYQSQQRFRDKTESLNSYELIHVWGTENMDLVDCQLYFSDYFLLIEELVVSWVILKLSVIEIPHGGP